MYISSNTMQNATLKSNNETYIRSTTPPRLICYAICNSSPSPIYPRSYNYDTKNTTSQHFHSLSAKESNDVKEIKETIRTYMSCCSSDSVAASPGNTGTTTSRLPNSWTRKPANCTAGSNPVALRSNQARPSLRGRRSCPRPSYCRPAAAPPIWPMPKPPEQKHKSRSADSPSSLRPSHARRPSTRQTSRP